MASKLCYQLWFCIPTNQETSLTLHISQDKTNDGSVLLQLGRPSHSDGPLLVNISSFLVICQGFRKQNLYLDFHLCRK